MALITCKECGTQISEFAKLCPSCGVPIAISKNQATQEEKISRAPYRQTAEGQQQIVINQVAATPSNGIGTAGFVCALVALFIGWVPAFGWILWVVGLVLSFVGVFKAPKGLAIAGLAISFVGLIVMLIVIYYIMILPGIW
ncbi:MAG: zinc-ribbon domain-containing protein [Prevotellaceae bacterium]|jgi:FtsH-binding integral membrane protein|nr:zinc-ribbon domain-containing protein [Prevotellaceae bacterium]